MQRFTGTVVSANMPKTAVVKVKNRWMHPVYKKTITKVKKYLCHNELNSKPGDQVIIASCRPISKRKKWKIIKLIDK